MSFSNPATKSEFFDTLPIQDVQLALRRQVQINNLGGGEILQAELAPAIWGGSVALAAMPKRQAAAIQAQLAALEAPGRVFQAYKAHQIGPAEDRLAATLGAASPAISELDSAAADGLKLDGLPAGYEISAGDFLAFDYDQGTGPRRALHQVVVGAVADGTGALPDFLRLAPAVRPGALVGTAVELVKPHFLAVLVPGSVSYGITVGNVTSGMRFDFRQTLRA